MKYFQNPQTQEVFAYDETDPTQVPYIEAAIKAGWKDITGNWPSDDIKKEQCAAQAKYLLQQTDWSVLPDVTLGTPKLDNQSDFVSYRSSLRELAVNPVANPVWPTEPTPVWS